MVDKLITLGLWLGISFSSSGTAQPADFDQWWQYATLYSNNDNHTLQKLAFTGRTQAEGYYFDSNQGDTSDSLWRRARFGFKANLYQNWVAHIEADYDFNESLKDSYNRLTDAYIGWTPKPGTQIKLLKQSAGFTLDGATSSKKLITLQRSSLTNNLWFTAEYFTGATIAARADNKTGYRLGIYSNDGDDEMSEFNASYFTLASVSRNLADRFAIDKAIVTLDYVYNKEHSAANTRDFSQIISLHSQWLKGKTGLATDLSAGEGYAEQANLWGFTLMPFYNQTERLQTVLRYTYIKSTGSNGIRLGRYENEIESGRGNRYNEIYAGFNVYFYGHQLKWQTGAQYVRMDDTAADGGKHEGWGLTSGLRASW